jgi:DNA-binding IclR family transcriptional regulator
MGTISKALELLNLFSRSRPAIGLGQFVRLTGRDKATLHRHLVELEANGFLEQDAKSRAYRLGPAILRLTGVREATHPVRSALRPIVTRLSEEVGELVHASLLQGDQLSPALHADPCLHGTQVHFDEAELLPLHATSSGLAVLAFGRPGLLEEVLSHELAPFTATTVTRPETLRTLVDAVRSAGYSRNHSAFDAEVASQGVPIFGPEGHAVGALSVAVPSVRTSEAKLDQMLPALARGVIEATRALGGVLPAEHQAKWQHAAPTHAYEQHEGLT